MAMDSSEGSDTFTSSAKVAVVLLMGLPGSGKTTLCMLLPQFLGVKYHIIHICYDQVIPFKLVLSQEEKNSLWKNERAKVVQATEVLLNNLFGANSEKNKNSTHAKESIQDVHKATQCINDCCIEGELKFRSVHGELIPGNRHTANFIDGKCAKTRHCNHDVNPRFTQEYVKVRDGGHYTMLDSINDIVSIRDKISECDLQNEIFILCIDDNCYYRSMRKEWWNLAAKYELPFCIVMLKCEVEVCMKRVRERLNGSGLFSPNVPDTVIDRMNKNLEYPDGNLYPWEDHSVVIDSNSLNVLSGNLCNSSILSNTGIVLDKFSLESLNKIRKLVNASLREPAKFLKTEILTESNTPLEATSVVHAADLALRKIVSTSDPKIRHQVNAKRKHILEDLRNKKLVFPNVIVGDLREGSGSKFDEYVVMLVNQHY